MRRGGGGGGGDRNRRGVVRGQQGPPIYFLPERLQALFVARPPLQPWPRYTAEGELIVKDAAVVAPVTVAAAPTAAEPAQAAPAEDHVAGEAAGAGEAAPGMEDGSSGGGPASAGVAAEPAGQAQPMAVEAPAPAASAQPAATAAVVAEAEEEEERPHSSLEGVAGLLGLFESTPPPPPPLAPLAPAERRERRRLARALANAAELQAALAAWNPRSDPSITGNALATLFVGRLPKDCTDRQLAQHFKGMGEIKDLRIVKDRKDKARGYAFVEFENEADVKVSGQRAPPFSTAGGGCYEHGGIRLKQGGEGLGLYGVEVGEGGKGVVAART